MKTIHEIKKKGLKCSHYGLMGLAFLANIILKYLFFASSVLLLDKNDHSDNVFVLNASKFS